MADDPIKSFMVSLGFTGDTAGAKKVVDLANTTEAAITKAAEGGASDRVEAENNASNERIGIIKALGKIFVAQEEDRTKREEKIKKDAAARDEKLQEERERKAKERRAKALKEIQAQATRMASFALKAVGAIEATALGIVVATEKAARSMERLGYASQRAGSTASKTTAVGYAFSQLGGQAADGEAAVSAVGGRLKENPAGYSAALKSIGVEARKANGEMRDTADIVTDLGEALARIRKQGGQYGYAQAKARGAQFGLGEDQTQTLMDPRFRAMESEGAAIDAKTGADRDKAAAGGTAFEQSFRRLEQMADSIRTKISTNLFAALTPELDKLAKWADEHGAQVSKWIDRAAQDVIALAHAVTDQLAKIDWDKVLTAIENFGKEFDKTTKELFGEDGPIIATLAVFGTLIAAKVLGPLNLVLGVLTRIGGVPLVGKLLAGGINPVTTTAAVVTTAAVADAEMARRTGAAMTSGDPNAKFDPETGFVNDLDFGYGGKEKNAGAGGSKAWAWFKGLFGGGSPGSTDGNALHRWDEVSVQGSPLGKLKAALGFGDADPDAKRVKDAILATAEATKKLADKTDGVGGAGSGASAPGGRIPNLRYGPGGHTPGSASAGGGEGGSRSWRNNNPGNISAGKFARAHGADGSDGRFAHFPTYEAGRKAQEALWFDSDTYKGLTLEQAVTKWSPPGENDTAGLIRRYGIAAGIGPTTPLSRLSADQRSRLLDAQQAAEGWKVGSRTNGVSGPGSVGSGDVVGNAEKYLGFNEGQTRNAMHHLMSFGEWCADFVNANIEANGGKGSGKSTARSFMNWGKGIDPRDSRRGDVAVVNHGGHVGLFTGKRDSNGNLEIVAGNTRDGHGGHRVIKYFVSPDQVYGARRGEQSVKVDVTDKSAERIGHGIAKGAARAALGHRNDHLAATQAVLRAHRGHTFGVDPHSTLGRSIRHSIDNSRRQVSMTHAPVFNMNGGDPHAMLADAHRLAGRGQADLVRNMSAMTA